MGIVMKLEEHMQMSEKDRYEIAREHVRREDDLVNYRTTWFLATQAFLFAAFFQVVGLGDPDKLKAFQNPYVVMSFLIVALAAAAIAVSIGWSVAVWYAARQIGDVETWLAKQNLTHEAFPPLRQKNSSTVTVPAAALVLSGVWVAMALTAVKNLGR